MNRAKRWAGIARLGGIGDNLIAASVLAPLKRMGYMVDVITSEPNHVVFHHNPHIDKLSVKKKDIPEGGDNEWQKWFRAREGEYDLFVNLSHSCEAHHSFFPTMSQFWWPQEYRRKLAGGSYLETAHDIVGVPHEFGPLYFTSEEERARALEVKKRMGPSVIGWVIAGSRIDKLHPYTAMAIGRIIKELNIPVMMVGAPNDRQLSSAQAVQDHILRQNGSLEGLHTAITMPNTEKGGHQNWPIRRSIAQLYACDLVITPDTGLAWAVAMEFMPKILMVSHASAENISKHWVNTLTLKADQDRVPCHPCHRLHNDPSTCVPTKDGVNAASCMADISVECILDAVQASLTQKFLLMRKWSSNVAAVSVS